MYFHPPITLIPLCPYILISLNPYIIMPLFARCCFVINALSVIKIPALNEMLRAEPYTLIYLYTYIPTYLYT